MVAINLYYIDGARHGLGSDTETTYYISLQSSPMTQATDRHMHAVWTSASAADSPLASAG